MESHSRLAGPRWPNRAVRPTQTFNGEAGRMESPGLAVCGGPFANADQADGQMSAKGAHIMAAKGTSLALGPTEKSAGEW